MADIPMIVFLPPSVSAPATGSTGFVLMIETETGTPFPYNKPATGDIVLPAALPFDFTA